MAHHRLWSALTALVLVASVVALHRYRRGFIQQFFVVGPGGAPPPALPGAPGAPLAPSPRTRVVLIDGLGAESATGLPAYDAACAAGLDLIVDVGFPTVSLPIQRALWTGLTQQQSGAQYAIAAMPPSLHDIPGQVIGSVAVSEGHPEIVESFRFAETTSLEDPLAFQAAALGAIAGDSQLVFVHVLRVDVAGHRHGGASPEYRGAASAADELLAQLRRADPKARWFVLSDHGHRPAGGHGGAEPAIRKVRACVAGGALPRAAPGSEIHLVDLARAVADSVGARLPPASAGRPLEAALAAGSIGEAALPRPPPWRWAAAAAILVAAIAATAWGAGRLWWALPLWWPLAYGAVVLIEAAPSLSVPMVYKPLGRTVYVAALPGLCVLALLAALAMRRRSAPRVAVAKLAIPAALAAAALVLAGVGGAGPPLVPGWTARASVWLILGFSGAAVVALAALATAVRPGSGRTRPTETGDRAA